MYERLASRVIVSPRAARVKHRVPVRRRCRIAVVGPGLPAFLLAPHEPGKPGPCERDFQRGRYATKYFACGW